jgi:hypothetical protein
MERYPLPRKSMAERIVGYNPSELWSARRLVLRAFLSEAKPRFLVAYGKPAQEGCAQLIEVARWTSIASTDCQVGRSLSGVVVCRTGFFGQGLFNRNHLSAIATEMQQLASGVASLQVPPS